MKNLPKIRLQKIKCTLVKRGDVSPSLGSMLAERKSRAEQPTVANRTHEDNGNRRRENLELSSRLLLTGHTRIMGTGGLKWFTISFKELGHTWKVFSVILKMKLQVNVGEHNALSVLGKEPA